MAPNFPARKQNYYSGIKSLLAAPSSKKTLAQAIVDAPFSDPLAATYICLGIVVFLQVSGDGAEIRRIALSKTEHAEGAVRASEKKFDSIVVPYGYKGNIIAEAIMSGEERQTDDWRELFIPALTPESARFNQANAGIVYSRVSPLMKTKHRGAIIFSFYARPVSQEQNQRQFVADYTRFVETALSRFK